MNPPLGISCPALAPASSVNELVGERQWAGTVHALTDWLIREGRFLPGNAALLTQFSERLVKAGLPLDRASLHLRALHVQYRGVSRIWQPSKPLDERFLDHGIEKSAIYLESPVRAAIESDQQLEWRLDKGGLLAFATLDELREEGFTHYVIAPIRYASGSINAFSWATKQPGGFTPAEMALCEELLPALSAVIEAKALRRFTENMLQTYVGREPTRLILDGQVRRGDIRTITAALMLVDLRDFTLISDGLAPRAVIRLLNEYFDCVFPAVRQHGGEIMEIMGDGVLAIFHQEEISAAASCREALAAARESLAAVTAFNMRGRAGRQNGNGNVPPMQVGIALHYGTVSYGNIGSGDRLDFTVIGPDVNLTSRIERFCRELDRTLIMSEIFVDTLGQEKLAEPMWELGYFQLRGFNRMQRLFALPSEER